MYHSTSFIVLGIAAFVNTSSMHALCMYVKFTHQVYANAAAASHDSGLSTLPAVVLMTSSASNPSLHISDCVLKSMLSICHMSYISRAGCCCVCMVQYLVR